MALALVPLPAAAIPYFAHEYGMTCQKCHTVVPRLSAFGEAFLQHGYQLPGAVPRGAVPLAVKANIAYAGDVQPDVPKAVVDEIEVFLAGTAGPRTNYFVEQYVVDGGHPGQLRDAWVAQRLTPVDARVPVSLRAGSFTLPLPVDPETFRESYQHYALFDATVGANPFEFFDPKIGLQVGAGAPDHGASIAVAALQGHDRGSGLPATGTDLMTYVQQTAGPVVLSAYRYDGTRPDAGVADRFRRQGYGLTFASGRWSGENVFGTGRDATYGGAPASAYSDGFFSQLRYEFGAKAFAALRYEGTDDPDGSPRDAVALAGFRISHNSRLTVEDVLTHAPSAHHSFATQYTVAY